MCTTPPDLGRRLPTLEGARVALRWIEAGDLPALEAIFSDPEVTRFLGTPRIRGRRDAERFLDEIRTGFR
ncbi:MAG: GNAT family N-acetyltransferase, partial [Acidobacteriota bacterium]